MLLKKRAFHDNWTPSFGRHGDYNSLQHRSLLHLSQIVSTCFQNSIFDQIFVRTNMVLWAFVWMSRRNLASLMRAPWFIYSKEWSGKWTDIFRESFRVSRPIRRVKKLQNPRSETWKQSHDACMLSACMEGSISSPKSVHIGVLWYWGNTRSLRSWRYESCIFCMESVLINSALSFNLTPLAKKDKM